MPSHHLRATVGEFHRAAGVHRILRLNHHERMAMAALRAELLDEEGRELREADNAFARDASPENKAHLAKELGDVVYVAAGTSDILATPLPDPRIVRPTHPFFAEGLVVRRVKGIVNKLNLLVHQIDVGWSNDELADEISDIGSDIEYLVHACFVMAQTHGIPLYEVFFAVHASNMSKINPETGRVEHREDGKILKGPDYHEADLSFLSQIAA